MTKSCPSQELYMSHTLFLTYRAPFMNSNSVEPCELDSVPRPTAWRRPRFNSTLGLCRASSSSKKALVDCCALLRFSQVLFMTLFLHQLLNKQGEASPQENPQEEVQKAILFYTFNQSIYLQSNESYNNNYAKQQRG